MPNPNISSDLADRETARLIIEHLTNGLDSCETRCLLALLDFMSKDEHRKTSEMFLTTLVTSLERRDELQTAAKLNALGYKGR